MEYIGGNVSHYRILDKLGEGGMGAVYKARDQRLDRFVAIKFLPPSLSADPTAKKRFMHEARAASQMDLPCEMRISALRR
jgi:eukaryotic-like serine/threonine-protein kinase